MRPETTEPSEHATGLKLKFREQLFTPFTVSFSTRDNRTRRAVASVSLSLCSLGLSDYFTDSLYSVVDAGQRGSRNLHVVLRGGGGVRTSCHAPLRLARQSTTPVLLLSRDYNIYNRSIFTIHKRNAVQVSCMSLYSQSLKNYITDWTEHFHKGS